MGFEGPTPGLRGSYAEASASSREPRRRVSRAAGLTIKSGRASSGSPFVCEKALAALSHRASSRNDASSRDGVEDADELTATMKSRTSSLFRRRRSRQRRYFHARAVGPPTARSGVPALPALAADKLRIPGNPRRRRRAARVASAGADFIDSESRLAAASCRASPRRRVENMQLPTATMKSFTSSLFGLRSHRWREYCLQHRAVEAHHTARGAPLQTSPPSTARAPSATRSCRVRHATSGASALPALAADERRTQSKPRRRRRAALAASSDSTAIDHESTACSIKPSTLITQRPVRDYHQRMAAAAWRGAGLGRSPERRRRSSGVPRATKAPPTRDVAEPGSRPTRPRSDHSGNDERRPLPAWRWAPRPRHPP